MDEFLTTPAELTCTAAPHLVEMSSEPDSPGPSEISEGSLTLPHVVAESGPACHLAGDVH
ncbi:Hypothetical predicted protein [Pelobates cultripes]|uniref:Uncharacterized protein n=1 Tax=Pelobates cultripes TaxID=61616 RepID=A0AAD1SNF7_PELCU|nr:Hypothetical predicted protein [Pelobates cultripes]